MQESNVEAKKGEGRPGGSVLDCHLDPGSTARPWGRGRREALSDPSVKSLMRPRAPASVSLPFLVAFWGMWPPSLLNKHSDGPCSRIKSSVHFTPGSQGIRGEFSGLLHPETQLLGLDPRLSRDCDWKHRIRMLAGIVKAIHSEQKGNDGSPGNQKALPLQTCESQGSD